MTENVVLSVGSEVIGAVVAIVLYVVKQELYENLLTSLLGRLALCKCVHGYHGKQHCGRDRDRAVSVGHSGICISDDTVDPEKTLELGRAGS